jgi:hypothetical protein
MRKVICGLLQSPLKAIELSKYLPFGTFISVETGEAQAAAHASRKDMDVYTWESYYESNCAGNKPSNLVATPLFVLLYVKLH